MEEVIGAIQCSIVLMGSAFEGISFFERHHFRRVIKHDFAEICKASEQSEDPKPSKFLFGDDLSSKATISDENKLFNQVYYDHKTTRPKKSCKSSAVSNSFKPFHKNTGGVSTRRVVFKKKQWKNKSDSKNK